MLADFKFAFRSLRKSPGFTAVAVLTFALGIGVNTAIFSMFHQLLLGQLPVREPQRLVNLSNPGPKLGGVQGGISGGSDDVFSYPMFRDLERVQKVFTGIAAHQFFKANIARQGLVREGAGSFVSGGYFNVLGLQPALGRLLGAGDDVRNGPEVAVLSYRYWQSRFNGDPAVLNGVLTVNGQPLTIVGVAPKGFDGTAIGVQAEVFVPMFLKERLDSQTLKFMGGLDVRLSYWVNLFARLKPGISMEQAKTQLDVSYRAILRDVEEKLLPPVGEQMLQQFRAKEIVLSPGERGRNTLTEAMGAPFMLLSAVAGMVLLIACSNAANLLMARGAARRPEIALRLSLGASRGAVVRQLLSESAVLAVAGGLAGVACSYWTLQLVTASLPTDLRGALSAGIDITALMFATGLTVAVALLSGLLPALHATRLNLLSSIKGQAVPFVSDRGAQRIRGTLIGVQAVMAMLLLVSAGLLIKSLDSIGRVDLGLKVDSLVALRVSPELNGYEPSRSQALFQRLESEFRALPGVTDVAASAVPVLGGQSSVYGLKIQGFQSDPNAPATAAHNEINAGYFRALGIPLIAGRKFDGHDAPGAARVAIVNERFARKYGLGNTAVGKSLWLGSREGEREIRIVGVVQDSKYDSVKKETPPQFFLPYRQNDLLGSLSFYVRAALAPQQLLSAISRAVSRIDPTLPIEQPKTMRRQVDDNVFIDRFIGGLCVAFAMLATLLAAVGLYGMLAYTVAQRTREIGIRMALGAQPRSVAWPIVRDALRLAGIGVVVGGLIALGLAGFIRHILFGVEPHDPGAMVGAAVFLMAVVTAAAWIPAWRASKVDPMVALRTE